MIELARKFITSTSTGSWEGHLHTIQECVPIFVAVLLTKYVSVEKQK